MNGIAIEAARRFGIAAGLLALATSAIGVTEAQAEPQSETLTLSVVLDPSTFVFDNVTGSPAEGPFAVEGTIFLECEFPDCGVATPIGRFDGWGWLALDTSGAPAREKASHVYTIGFDGEDMGVDLDEGTAVDVLGGPAPELGRIMAQGIEVGGEKGFLAVAGGTDDFANVRGDAVMDFGARAEGQLGFDVTFTFSEAAAKSSSAQ